MNQKNRKIFPFVILPYGKKQSMVFYGNIGMAEHVWRNLIFGDFISKNKMKNVCVGDISRENTIIVYKKRNITHIFHIYPTECVERFSGRRGLYFIIGFRMDYRLLKKQPKQIANSLTCFFDAISRCCIGYMYNDDISVPTRFVTTVNVRAYNNYIQRCLSEAEDQMQNLLLEELNKPMINNKIYIVYDIISKKCRFNNLICLKKQF